MGNTLTLDEIDARDLHKRAADFFRCAHGHYEQHGRGSLLIDYRQVVNGGRSFRTLYFALENEIGWPSDAMRAAVEAYDPEAEFMVMLIGRSDGQPDDTMRWHRYRYRDMAA